MLSPAAGPLASAPPAGRAATAHPSPRPPSPCRKRARPAAPDALPRRRPARVGAARGAAGHVVHEPPATFALPKVRPHGRRSVGPERPAEKLGRRSLAETVAGGHG